jgi:hypothetical protein
MRLATFLGAGFLLIFGALEFGVVVGIVQGLFGEPGYMPGLQATLLLVYGGLAAFGYILLRLAHPRLFARQNH